LPGLAHRKVFDIALCDLKEPSVAAVRVLHAKSLDEIAQGAC
jgi:hypothetical protein